MESSSIPPCGASKSGAALNVSTPAVVIPNSPASVPLRVYPVTLSSASGSVAVTVPTAVVCSGRLKLALDVKAGAWFAVTVTVTVSRSLPPLPSMTVTRKVSVAALDGAVKVGPATVVSLNVTVAPAVCSQL